MKAIPDLRTRVTDPDLFRASYPGLFHNCRIRFSCRSDPSRSIRIRYPALPWSTKIIYQFYWLLYRKNEDEFHCASFGAGLFFESRIWIRVFSSSSFLRVGSGSTPAGSATLPGTINEAIVACWPYLRKRSVWSKSVLSRRRGRSTILSINQF